MHLPSGEMCSSGSGPTTGFESMLSLLRTSRMSPYTCGRRVCTSLARLRLDHIQLEQTLVVEAGKRGIERADRDRPARALLDLPEDRGAIGFLSQPGDREHDVKLEFGEEFSGHLVLSISPSGSR